MMRIIVAETAGFCWGVQRAIDQALNTAKVSRGKVYTHGPLIHNNQVVDELRRKNIETLEGDVENAKDGTLVIRAHGIRPDILKEIKEKHPRVVDATCPLVTKVHRKIAKHQKEGYRIYIMGEKDHPEVVGLLGTANADAVVIPPNPEVVRELTFYDGKICLVSQTTQNDGVLNTVAGILKDKCYELLVENTICQPTRSHQSETVEMAKMVEMVVVVGGRHSANTKHLAELAASLGPKVIHVETDAEINESDFKDIKTVGVTAGASTPQWMIQRVVDKLESINSSAGIIKKIFNAFLEVIIPTNLYSTAAFVAIFTASSYYLNSAINIPLLIASLAVIFGIHNFNEYGQEAGFDRRSRFTPVVYERFRKTMLIISSASLTVGISYGIYHVLAEAGSELIPVVLFLASAGGIVYGKQLVPGSLIQKFGFRSIKDLPGSKDLSITFGWTLVFTVMTLADSHTGRAEFLILPVLLFLSIYRRSAIISVRDVQGDRIVGMESSFKFIGKDRALVLLRFVDISSLILLWGFLYLTGVDILKLPLIVSVMMGISFSVLYQIRRLPQSLSGQFIMDSQFVFPLIVGLILDSLIPY